MSIAPRAWVHRGVVTAQGLLLSSGLTEVEAKKRVMLLWLDGSRLLDCSGRWLLLFPSQRSLVCSNALGAPLVSRGPLVSSLPLSEAEYQALCEREGLPPKGDASHVLWRDRGVLHCEQVSSLTEIDPASWFDVSALRVDGASALAVPVPPTEVLLESETDSNALNLRERLGIGEASPEQLEMLAKLRGESTSGGPSWFARFKFGARERSRRAEAKPNPLGRFWDWLVPRHSTTPEMSTGLVAPQRDAPGLLDKAKGWWLRRIMSSRLGRVLGRRQGKYLSKVLDLFESGNFEEAMKRAIPLKDGGGEAAPAMRLPGRRNELRISMARATRGSSIGLDDNTYDVLRRQYRRALKQLLRDEKIDEALFMLLELLKEDEEGIALLEKHERYEMAAEVAESRGMPPARMVRQWLLAGDAERALRVARRHHAFAPAVRMLEASHPEEAARLTLWWADWAATSGDYVTAVDAAWTVAPRLAATWIDRGIAFGGVAAARLVVRKVELDAESANGDALDVVRGILADETRQGREARLALGQALLDARTRSALGGVARGLLRSLVRDHDGDERATHMLKVLGKHYAPVESADLPELAKPAASGWQGLATHYEITSSDRGSFEVFDACLLPRGEVLVALGDVGCALLRRDGSWKHHFRAPAEQLVISDSGTRAIGVSPRGRTFQLTRLNLDTRREARWIDVLVCDEEWAPRRPFPASYDGALLPCVDGESIAIYDALEAGPVVLWRVGGLGMQVVRVARTTEWLHVLGRHPGSEDEAPSWERFSYALPSLRLHERQQLESSPNERVVVDWNIAEDGAAFVAFLNPEPPLVRETALWNGIGYKSCKSGKSGHKDFERPPDRNVVAMAFASGEQALLAKDLAVPGKAKLWHKETFTASVDLGGAKEIRGRVQRIHGGEKDIAILFDDCGRVLWFDSERGELVGSLRIRAGGG